MGVPAAPASTQPPRVSQPASARVDALLVTAAVAAAVVAVTGCAATVLLRRWLQANGVVLTALSWSDMVIACSWPAVGVLLVRAQPRNLVGWLLVVPAWVGPYTLLAHYALASAAAPVGSWPGGSAAAWVGAWGFAAYWFAVPLLPLLFPDGRLPSRRWRPAAAVVVGLAGAATLAVMFNPGPLDYAPQVTNPLGIPGAEWLRYVVVIGSFGTILGGTACGVLAVLARARWAVGMQRAQLQWLLLGGVVFMLLTIVPTRLLPPPFDDVVFGIALVAFPASIGVAILRHGLFDVTVALNRTVVYVAVTAAVVAIYLGAVFATRELTAAPVSSVSVLLVAAAALLAAFARDYVQRVVDRLLFGHRHDPYAVLSHIGRHVAPASEPAGALQRLVDGLRTALRLPYVAYVGASQVSVGDPVAGWRAVPALALGQSMGELRVGLRGAGERWTATEQEAVDEVATRAATLDYAAGLVADVAASRSRIVAAREEERRRLMADLHDGVGPVLAGTAHQLDALARAIESHGEPQLAARARALRDQIRNTVSDVRALVHGLRPPILDQVGLATALRNLVKGYDTPTCTSDVPADLGTLPAAVEVAAYTIAAEAVTNALRHSAASQLHLHALLAGDTLVIQVRDNGCGVPARPTAGVGLRSMGERAAEVGGRLDLSTTPGGGTTVHVALPTELP